MTSADREQWLPIPGFHGYDVSDQGRVRSWLQWRRTPVPRILAGTPNPNGYLTVGLHRHTKQIHQLVMLAFVGPRPASAETRHLDGDQLNNVQTNLVYGSHSENQLDSVIHGTHYQAIQTHCARGHRWDERNTLHTAGIRACRACNRENNRLYRARQRSEAA